MITADYHWRENTTYMGNNKCVCVWLKNIQNQGNVHVLSWKRVHSIIICIRMLHSCWYIYAQSRNVTFGSSTWRSKKKKKKKTKKRGNTKTRFAIDRDSSTYKNIVVATFWKLSLGSGATHHNNDWYTVVYNNIVRRIIYCSRVIMTPSSVMRVSGLDTLSTPLTQYRIWVYS